MALFKIEKGTAANLVANRPNAVEGYAYFTTDDGKFYIDVFGGTSESPISAIVGTNRIPLSADRADRIPYAENNEGSLIYDKTITTSDPFTLRDGNLIVIKFTATTPGGTTGPNNIITFNINNTGAKHVYYRGARIPNDHLVSNKIYLFKVTSFQTYTEDDPPVQITDYRYEMVGDVIPDLAGHETVITDNYGRLTTRPFMDSFEVVQTLPSEVAIDENVVYLVPTGESGAGGGSGSGGGGINLPDQTNNSGKFLTTDGTNISWATITQDDHKWNDVSLNKSETPYTSDLYIPTLISTSNTSAYLLKACSDSTIAYSLVRRNAKGYILANTPASGDDSLKVATTAFVNNKVSSLGTVLNYKGTKATVAALPSSENTAGDVWIVTANNSEHVWNGTAWEELGPTIDLSGYVPTNRTINNKALSSNITLTASDVGALNETQVQALIDATITTALSTAYPTA